MELYFCNTFSYLFYHASISMFIIYANSAPISVERSTYIVHTTSIMLKAFTTHPYRYSSIVDSLNSTKFSYSSPDDPHYFPPSLIHAYDNALHGFSASFSLEELEELKQSPWLMLLFGTKAKKQRH